MWTASELARRWSAHHAPDRDAVREHRLLEEAALARDADAAAEALVRHLALPQPVWPTARPTDSRRRPAAHRPWWRGQVRVQWSVRAVTGPGLPRATRVMVSAG
ncbi:hypothetical protein GCM10018790_01880 [Kitasatospora xanthocidica]|nr:hypothetical protein GCM10018790_01880 [Kitasatospora xanthocidica]